MGLRHVVTRWSTANGRLPPEPAANTQQPPDLPRCRSVTMKALINLGSLGRLWKPLPLSVPKPLVDDPLKYSVVVMEEATGKVESYVEMPKTVNGNYIDVGIYLLNSSVLDRIKLRLTSLEKVFSKIAAKQGLYAMMLTGKKNSSELSLGSHTRGNVLIDRLFVIGKDCLIGPLWQLDRNPEYAVDSQLTDKSDVYSFGVVLLELLTSRKAIEEGGHDNDHNELVAFAKKKNEENRFMEIVDSGLREAASQFHLQTMMELAVLAFRCLEKNRHLRPTMKEVAQKIKKIVLRILTRFEE
ncbi:hypothetical protein Scep_021382 [Stephania cephalantha]|uniref:Uncharacterized protein n=1 Tax=Stephania cephalantha TaxID=152367 RepID=A0AAP0F8E2_9MAGN